jgi:hypothetical protein
MKQEHFSLMAEMLDPDLPESDQIEALLRHASKELSITVSEVRSSLSKAAARSLQRAFLLNDVLTAMQSAIQRLDIRWLMEDSGQERLPESPEYIEFLKTALVPPLGERSTGGQQ